VIERGAEQLGWELDKLLTLTLEAMKATEDDVAAEVSSN
jgi:predicted hydrolase (HD superfamily)